MNDERRSEPRFDSDRLQLVARDALSGNLIGSVANLSERGMMLNASTALEPEGVLQLQLSRASDPDRIILELALRVSWIADAKTPGNLWAGGKIIAMGDAQAKTLRSLLEEAQTGAA